MKYTLLDRVNFHLFLIDFFQTGQVTVPRQIKAIPVSEQQEVIGLLADFYDKDVLEMPGTAPDFHAGAALWGAQLIFHIIQLILIRDAGEPAIVQYLIHYPGESSPEAIYSADLMLRSLPDLFRLSRGLSPEDPLVARLREIAAAWPFSTVGIKDVESKNLDMIFQHPSLRQAYIDRVLTNYDLARLKHNPERELLKEILGSHQDILWPEMPLFINEIKNNDASNTNNG